MTNTKQYAIIVQPHNHQHIHSFNGWQYYTINCPFIAAKQAAKQASKCIRLNRCWMTARRFKFPSFYSPSFDV